MESAAKLQDMDGVNVQRSVGSEVCSKEKKNGSDECSAGVCLAGKQVDIEVNSTEKEDDREVCSPGKEDDREVCSPGKEDDREVCSPGKEDDREVCSPGKEDDREVCSPEKEDNCEVSSTGKEDGNEACSAATKSGGAPSTVIDGWGDASSEKRSIMTAFLLNEQKRSREREEKICSAEGNPKETRFESTMGANFLKDGKRKREKQGKISSAEGNRKEKSFKASTVGKKKHSKASSTSRHYESGVSLVRERAGGVWNTHAASRNRPFMREEDNYPAFTPGTIGSGSLNPSGKKDGNEMDPSSDEKEEFEYLQTALGFIKKSLTDFRFIYISEQEYHEGMSSMITKMDENPSANPENEHSSNPKDEPF